eukprot:3744414-Amphidinium_carterae.1
MLFGGELPGPILCAMGAVFALSQCEPCQGEGRSPGASSVGSLHAWQRVPAFREAPGGREEAQGLISGVWGVPMQEQCEQNLWGTLLGALEIVCVCDIRYLQRLQAQFDTGDFAASVLSARHGEQKGCAVLFMQVRKRHHQGLDSWCGCHVAQERLPARQHGAMLRALLARRLSGSATLSLVISMTLRVFFILRQWLTP